MKRNITTLALVALVLLPLLAVSGERSKIKFTLLKLDATDPKSPVGVFSFRQIAMLWLDVHGWDTPTNGHFGPRFIEFQVQTNGGWRSLWLDHCGAGAQTYPLRSGRTYTFNVPLPFTNRNERARIGILTGRQAIHWSDSFRLVDYESESQ